MEKIEITALTFGLAQAAVEEAWEYAQQRMQFGKPISGHQAVRHSLVDARTKLEAWRHMLYHATRLADARSAVAILLACQRVMGAYGLSESYDMERHVRDVIGMPIVGDSSSVQRNNIARLLRLAG